MTAGPGGTLRLLWIATKPPWPPSDGGRLVQLLTLEALGGLGAAATVVAPVPSAAAALQAAGELERRLPGCDVRLVPAAPRSPVAALGAALHRRLPVTVARHALAAVAAVAEGVLEEGVDVVHVEQLQALPQVPPPRLRRAPVVLRQQNVESDLWRAAAELAHPVTRPWIAAEARRLARWEAAAVARAAAVVALTRLDAERLERLAAAAGCEARVTVVPAPFPQRLPAGEQPLAGSPPVVLLAGRGWSPNRDSRRWMLREVWPRVHRRTPGAVLHVFGGGGENERAPQGVVLHPAPADSVEAFPAGSVLVVPLRIASGVRMKILEAWARGVPVVATPQAASGLDAEDGLELLLATAPDDFAEAVSRLAADADLAGRLVAGGRRALASRHAPRRVAEELLAIYRRLAAV